MAESGELIRWIADHARAVRRTASVCSGTFLLAEAGLLDGKRAATHWAMCDRLGTLFPAIEVDNDTIFVEQDNVWASAGISAGIDLALSLVEADCGREVAMQVARELVAFLKRPGGQAQFSELLQAQTGDAAIFDELHRWLADNLGQPNLEVALRRPYQVGNCLPAMPAICQKRTCRRLSSRSNQGSESSSFSRFHDPLGGCENIEGRSRWEFFHRLSAVDCHRLLRLYTAWVESGHYTSISR